MQQQPQEIQPGCPLCQTLAQDNGLIHRDAEFSIYRLTNTKLLLIWRQHNHNLITEETAIKSKEFFESACATFFPAIKKDKFVLIPQAYLQLSHAHILAKPWEGEDSEAYEVMDGQPSRIKTKCD